MGNVTAFLDHVALPVHICGFALLILTLAREARMLKQVARAWTAEELRRAVAFAPKMAPRMTLATILLVASGLYMAGHSHEWNWTTPWILTAIGATAFMVVGGIAVMERRLKRIRRTAIQVGSGRLDPALKKLTLNRTLHNLGWSMMGMVAALVFIMGVQQGWLVSLGLLAAGAATGFGYAQKIRVRYPADVMV